MHLQQYWRNFSIYKAVYAYSLARYNKNKMTSSCVISRFITYQNINESQGIAIIPYQIIYSSSPKDEYQLLNLQWERACPAVSHVGHGIVNAV